MMQAFTPDALEFLQGIRTHNNKEWFEAHKQQYVEQVYEPLKAFGEVLFAPYASHPGMMHKVARIYKDAAFPPFLHYRDTMWIYVRHEAMYWNKTPTLFFELSPEGAEYGFRIPKPEAAVMERFRRRLTEDPAGFLELTGKLEAQGIVIGGDEYKRTKPCTVPELADFFRKKGLSASVKLPAGALLFSDALADAVLTVFAAVQPFYDLMLDIVSETAAAKAMEVLEPIEDDAPPMIQAPRQDFMW